MKRPCPCSGGSPSEIGRVVRIGEMRDRSRTTFMDAAQVVRSGGVVIVATETFYCLAADPFQEDAVRRIFTIKRRNESNPLPLIASSGEAVKRIIQPPAGLTEELMGRFWPGSLTILFEPSVPVTALLVGAAGRIGIRVPPPCPALTLAEFVGGLLTATSANLSGDPAPDKVSCVARQVLAAVDLILDSGPSPGGKPSTVVAIDDGAVRTIREGAVAIADLMPGG